MLSGRTISTPNLPRRKNRKKPGSKRRIGRQKHGSWRPCKSREQVKRSHSDALHAHWGSRLRRDSWVSVRYAEGLNSGKSSVTLQRTDRHGILVRQVALKRK